MTKSVVDEEHYLYFKKSAGNLRHLQLVSLTLDAVCPPPRLGNELGLRTAQTPMVPKIYQITINNY